MGRPRTPCRQPVLACQIRAMPTFQPVYMTCQCATFHDLHRATYTSPWSMDRCTAYTNCRHHLWHITTVPCYNKTQVPPWTWGLRFMMMLSLVRLIAYMPYHLITPSIHRMYRPAQRSSASRLNMQQHRCRHLPSLMRQHRSAIGNARMYLSALIAHTGKHLRTATPYTCLLYTSDAADE